MQDTYTVKEVAELLGYSTNSVYTFLKEKRIKSVRIGKGKFRIPRIEVQRLLALTAPSSSQKSSETLPVSDRALETTGRQPIPVSTPFPGEFWRPHAVNAESPSLFDWFVGCSSVLIGASLFLFKPYLEDFSFSSSASLLPTLRIWFIAAGMGLLLTDAAGLGKAVWYRIFYFLLCAAHLAMSMIFSIRGQWDAVILYGAAGITMIIAYPLRLRGTVSFSLYLLFFLLFFPIGFVLQLPSESIPFELRALTQFPLVVITTWMITVVLIAAVARITWTSRRLVFYIGLIAVTLLLMTTSLWYARHALWGRSIIILVLGFSACFIPVWNSFRFKYFQDRMIIFSAFGVFLSVLLFAIFVIALVSHNQVHLAQVHLDNTVNYGKIIIETAADTIESTLQHAAQNPLLQQGITTNDQQLISDIVRSPLESHRSLRDVLVADANGTVIATYPHRSATEKTIAFRSYFQKVKEQQKPVVSETILSAASDQRRKIHVAIPILSPTGEFMGTLVGSMNLEYLNFRLQQLAQSSMGEYILITDRDGTVLIAPFPLDEIADQPIRQAVLSGTHDLSGKRVLTATVETEQLQWTIRASVPLREALRLSNATSFVLFFIACIILVMLGSIGIWKARGKHLTANFF